MGRIQKLESHLMLLTGWTLDALYLSINLSFISVLILHSFCSAGTLQYSTSFPLLSSIFDSFRYLKFLFIFYLFIYFSKM